MRKLAKRYNDFYAPEAVVLIEGRDIASMGIAVSDVRVERTLEGASSFSFTLGNVLDHEYNVSAEYREVVRFGNRIEIEIGYGGDRVSVLKGVVTSIGWNFTQENYLDVEVEGYDYLFLLMKGRSHKAPWNDRRDSDVVRDIVTQRRYSLFESPEIEETEVVHSYIRQEKSESDYSFIVERLAKRNGFEVFMEGAKFHFRKPPSMNTAHLSLTYGGELLSFTPQLDLTRQVSKVEVYGWDPHGKERIVGRAERRDLGTTRSDESTGGDAIAALLKEDVVYKVRASVCTREEARQLAVSILREKSSLLLSGTATSVGIPDMKPGIVVEFKNLGERFSRNYYVERVTHRFSGGTYDMDFTVRGSTFHESA